MKTKEKKRGAPGGENLLRPPFSFPLFSIVFFRFPLFGVPGVPPPLLFLIFLSFVWFLFLDFLIVLFDFVNFLIDVQGLGDVRERGFGPVPVPAGSGSVRFRFSRFRRLVYLSANFEMHNLAGVF